MSLSVEYPRKSTIFEKTSKIPLYHFMNREIINHDIKPNSQDEKGQTLLFHLLSNADATIIMLYLHNFDHDLSITDESGETAFFMLHCLVYNSALEKSWRPTIMRKVCHTTAELCRMITYLLTFDKNGSILLKRNKRGHTALDNLDLYQQWVQRQLTERHWETRLKSIVEHVKYITIPISCHIAHKCTLFQIMYADLDLTFT